MIEYTPAIELSLAKSLISDNHVPVILGLSQSTGFASIVPLFNQTKTIGQPTQGAPKGMVDPFEPYFFAGACGFSDQADVGIAYEMKHLGLKSLKGVNVGVAAIQVASGQEVIDETTRLVTKLGGNVVVENLPVTLISADVQAQDLQAKNVKFVVLHDVVAPSIVFLRALDKFNVNVPVVAMAGATESSVFDTAPYSIAKDTVGINSSIRRISRSAGRQAGCGARHAVRLGVGQ